MIKRLILKLFYKLFPPSLTNMYKQVAMLNPGCDLVRYALYADGCYTIGMATNKGLYFEGDGGPRHAPHLSFFPNDIPVYEWGISKLKYGDKISDEDLYKYRELVYTL